MVDGVKWLSPSNKIFVMVPAAVALAPLKSVILTAPSVSGATSVCVIETVVVPFPPLTAMPPVLGPILVSLMVVVRLPLTVIVAVGAIAVS